MRIALELSGRWDEAARLNGEVLDLARSGDDARDLAYALVNSLGRGAGRRLDGRKGAARRGARRLGGRGDARTRLGDRAGAVVPEPRRKRRAGVGRPGALAARSRSDAVAHAVGGQAVLCA